MSTDDDLARAGEFGDKVAAFSEGEIGQYLERKVQADEIEIFQAFLELDPWDFNNLPDLQNAIARLQEPVFQGRQIKAYLADAIIAGQEADNLLMSKEDIHDD